MKLAEQGNVLHIHLKEHVRYSPILMGTNHTSCGFESMNDRNVNLQAYVCILFITTSYPILWSMLINSIKLYHPFYFKCMAFDFQFHFISDFATANDMPLHSARDAFEDDDRLSSFRDNHRRAVLRLRGMGVGNRSTDVSGYSLSFFTQFNLIDFKISQHSSI